MAGVCAAALLLAACGDDDDDDGGAAPDTTAAGEGGDDGEAEGPQTFRIGVDGRPEDVAMFFFAFFPNELQVHPGDSVEFVFADTGEPHTAGVGGVIQNALEVFESSGFDPEGDEPPPPELEEAFGKIPFVFPDGPPDLPLNQGAAQPCVAATEPVSVEEPCDTQDGPFTGTEALWNTGFVPGGESFTMDIAEDATPGDYTVMCLVHGPDMTMNLSIVDAGTAIPSPDEVEAAGEEALDAAIAELQPMAEEILASTDPAAASAGQFSETLDFPGAVSVFPENLEIAAGESVTWNFLSGPHTVSFNAPESARPIVTVAADGTVQINPEAAGPAGWAGPPPPPEEPPAEPPPPVDAGTFSGEGFHSSSLFFEGAYRLTFDTPGTYEYLCLVHPDMEGTVTVT